ncbi:YkgJ family cysteine cluster protein [Thermosyntropha sp.]|uniref:YkgJ family cysteine cluster protein n=1 Tax=Thermosyntropha sp. TaxID=2740820 RepID=UPI0025EE5C90|nr:YkgJ family cysteine cluster protein [Thermosyntropha sp.]MBO8158129.1 YkgJ family cysteine cluster protein [Thermosyntropha sp.]
MSKVKVIYEEGKIKIAHVADDANLQDLLDAWQPLCDDEEVAKIYAEQNNICKGCKINCCNTAYVIPDIISFKKIKAYLGISYEEFVHKYFQREKRELGILRLKPDPCIFLKENICTIYPLRTLLCRFYLCSEIEGKTEELIYKITWTGIAATQVFAQKNNLLVGVKDGGLSSFDLLFKKNIAEYCLAPNVELFLQASEYRDVPLRKFWF